MGLLFLGKAHQVQSCGKSETMKCIKQRCYSPVACGGWGYCRERNFESNPAWTDIDECKELLKAIDHTISIHGKVDAGTPLHERIRRTIELFDEVE